MRRLVHRPLPPRAMVAIAVVVAVAVAVVGLSLLTRPRDVDDRSTSQASGPTPSDAASPSDNPSASPAAPAPSFLTSAPPPPIPVPDAAQAALVAAGWSFLPLPAAGLSIVLPPGWTADAPGAPAALTEAFAAVGRDHPAYRLFTDGALASVKNGGFDLAAIDGSPDALASGGGAVLDGARWATAASTADLITSMKANAPESTDTKSFVADARDLASGHGDRLTFHYTSPRTAKPAVGIAWAVHTPRGVVVLRFRADIGQAGDLDRLAETIAGSVRPLAGRRIDVVPTQASLNPIAIVIDASDHVTPEWLTAEQQAVIDFLAELSWSWPITIVASGGPEPRVVVPLTSLYGRGPWEEAIRGIRIGGAPDPAAAIKAANAELAKQKFGGRQVVVLAASDVGFDGAAIAKSFSTGTEGEVHGIALGRGPQEAQAFALAGGTYAFNGYALAPTSADIGHALSLVRRHWDLGSLPIGIGRAVPGNETAVLVPAGAAQVRFTIELPSWIVAPIVVDPAGKRFGLDTAQPDAAVVEGDGQTAITIPSPAAGTWTIELAPGGGPPPADAPYLVETYGLQLGAHWPRGESRFGSGGPLEVAVGISSLGTDDQSERGRAVVATITVDDPTGATHARRMDRASTQELGISTDLVKGVTIYGTRAAGSYHLLMAIDGTDASGAPFHLAPETWHYIEPSVDADHDGLGDAYELAMGMNPGDPSDARIDDDRDGLPFDREIFDLWTDPSAYDTDGGREGDGSEVAAGRDPTNPVDDVPVAGCLANAKPTPAPAVGPTPVPSAARDPGLENLLPNQILGRRTTKFSIVGHPGLDTFLGPIFGLLAECVGATQADETTAYAIATDLRNWGVIAIQVRGHTGAELLDTFIHRVQPGNEDSLRLRDAEVDGRHYLRSEGSYALYAAGPTLYWVFSYNFGDFPPASQPPIPPIDDIVNDAIRSLPAS